MFPQGKVWDLKLKSIKARFQLLVRKHEASVRKEEAGSGIEPIHDDRWELMESLVNVHNAM